MRRGKFDVRASGDADCRFATLEDAIRRRLN